MIAKKKPLRRSKKPIKRSPIRRKPPRKKSPKQKKSALQRNKDNPFSRHYRQKCDTAFSKLIKDLAGNRCQKCGTTKRLLNTHHLILRQRSMTRCEIPNGICLCTVCHRLGSDSAHSITGSWQFIAWLQGRYPEKWVWMQEHGNDKGRVDWKSKLEWLNDYSDAIC